MTASGAPGHPPGSLQGIRVLDLSRVLAGPWATQILADLGADVIKVERPDGGDDTRSWGPPFLTNAGGERGDAAYYLGTNRNKRSIALNMADPAQLEAIRELASGCHVLVENFRTGGLQKYGLDYETLRERNPALVYCSITGFGQTGPSAHRPGYDFAIQAMSGLMSVTGERDGRPGAAPMKVGVATADLSAGLYAAIGILAALRHAEKTGQGQHLDIALLDCQVALLANQAMNYLVSGEVPSRLGNAHPNVVPYEVFTTSDGHLVAAATTDAQFAALCRALGLDLDDDERFATNSDRVENRAELVKILNDAFATRTASEWFAILEEAQVSYGPINDIAQVFDDPQVQHREMARRFATDEYGDLTLVASPLRMSETPPSYRLAPPRLGQHTEEILAGLGWDN
ncbi:MAG: CaiB/BaiF CoA-transferase family protein [bacterium]|nr:CaiB/BaiF CoA-transferase family protein [bacterium]